ncbi:MAG: phosphate ABC transporter substrate-binding protein PstS [Nitrososphaeraceae archaeon]|nr:phosphate ABC transporter substrate-binding protein PstS [Nitrososphaeraceae archaeon]
MKNQSVTGLIVVIAMLSTTMMISATTVAKSYAQQGQVTTINGAGATFPFPLIDTWRVEYQKVKPGININYQSIGSGGGVKQFTAKTVDFGASDAPLSDTERKAAPGAVHIPETIGSVAVAYNIPGIPSKALKFTGPVLADIFLGKTTKWNDPQIQALNPGKTLPSANIVVVHRSDGSGTTFVWTSFLSKESAQWNQQVGASKSVPWPIGIGAPGNEGVANAIKGSPNTIGYVELNYALTASIPYALIKNPAGNFIEPSLNSAEEAVSSSSIAKSLPAGDQSWTSVEMLNSPGKNAYPIASFTYLLLYKDMSNNPNMDQTKAKSLVDFISWAITDGQKFAPKLGYVLLPPEVVKHNQDTLKSLTFKGKSLYTGT